MTIKQLKEKIKELPDNMEVFIEKENGDFAYTIVEEAEVKKLKFSDGTLIAHDEVFLITDEL